MLEAPAQAPMEIGEYLRILRRRAWVIVVVTVVTVGAALAWSSTRDDRYTASGEVVVGSSAREDVATQMRIVGSQVVHRLALDQVPSAGTVRATQQADSGGINVEADSSDPELAATTVNAHIDAYVEYLRRSALDLYTAVAAEVQPEIDALQQRIDAIDAQLQAGAASATLTNERGALAAQLGQLRGRLTALQLEVAFAGRDVEVIRRASPPLSATSTSTRNIVIIAVGVGLLLGVLAALLLEFLDDSIRTRQDLLRVAGGDIPVLGVIPATRSARAEVVSLTRPSSPLAEAYRSLRTALHFAGADRARCVEITTARTRHGKTETVANLAVLAAQTGQRVVVVDCDMRYPRVHDFFDLPNDTGFTSVVYGAPLSEALKRVPGTDRLFVLPSGPIPPNPAELLASQRCSEVLASLQADDTLVLVDTPPLLLATDAAELAPAVSGILLVATACVSRRKQVRHALEALRQVAAPVLGMVLYRADTAETGGFGEEAGWRERRQARRRGKDRAAEPARAAQPGPSAEPSGPPSTPQAETG